MSPAKTLAIGVLAVSVLCVAAVGGEHPRLFFGADKVKDLRAKVAKEPFKGMVAEMSRCLDRDDWGRGKYDDTQPYQQSVRAQLAAFLYVVTGDADYARTARGLVERRLADTGAEHGWASGRVKGLRLYWHGARLAMCYDWCAGAPGWDEAFCKKVSAALARQAEVIFTDGGARQNRSPASNWQAGRYAAAGLCLLANDEPHDAARLAGCYDKVVAYLASNLGDARTSRGWNIEGLGYAYFAMGNYVGPFGIGMARKDRKKDIRKTVPAAGGTYWTVYAAMSKALGGCRPDFGDDNGGAAGEGTFGQAFWYAPDTLRPGMKFWYDRTWGVKGDRSFDRARAGTIWSVLYYPADLAEAAPMTIAAWRGGFVDTVGNGLFTYRNRYRDADDMIAQFYAKLRGAKGRNGPDALSFRILGLGTAWAVGGGRYGVKTGGQHVYWRSMNTVYPTDPDARLDTNAGGGALVGAPVSNSDGGGHLVCASRANNVGTRGHKRWFLADYSAASGAEAVYVIADRSQNGRYWQLCTLAENAIKVGNNTFTITAPNGNQMQGTVLYPRSGQKISTGTRARGSAFTPAGRAKNAFVHVRSDDGAFLVILTCVKKGKPHPDIYGVRSWAHGMTSMRIGGIRVLIDGDTIRPSLVKK